MYVKLSWRPEVDENWAKMVVQPAILTYPKLPFGHGRKGREGINGVGKVRRGYIVKFPHPMYFSLRRAKERSIRTRPSTVSPRNFVFWFFYLAGGAGTSLRHRREGREGINGVGKVQRGYIVKFPHPMYFSLRWAEERLLCAYSTLFSPTKVKVHGVCKFNSYWFFTFFWLTKGSRNKNETYILSRDLCAHIC